MPQLKISYVVSYSSEDKVHVANNLLGDKPSLKWKCKSFGELYATVIFQLEKASVISCIDIGNECSAFIEVLVSRSGGNDNYKTLLPKTSFMSTNESKEKQNKNRVKMFKKEDFCEPERNDKWDRIKVICGQPFNKHVQFGLSFIKFHTLEVNKNQRETLGKFTLRPESPINLTRGILFAKKKERVETKPSVAAEIRDLQYKIFNRMEVDLTPKFKPIINKPPSTSRTDVSPEPIKPRHRDELFYTEDDDKPNPRIDSYFERRKREKKKLQEEKEKADMYVVKKKVPEVKDKKLQAKDNTQETPKRMESADKKKRKIKTKDEIPAKKIKPIGGMFHEVTKPFHRLLEDVVLVISGIQNPDRATLRGKILEMGAKYKPDWDSTCTHLVCAYMNTPKFNQVKGRGKIVTRKWIEECYSQRKKIPWRRFALDKQEGSKEESEVEISEEIETIEDTSTTRDDDETMEPASDTEEKIEETKRKEEIKRKEAERKEETKRREANREETKAKETSREETVGREETKRKEPSTEETEGKEATKEDVYTVDTESEEETIQRKQQNKNKPFDFFKNKTFFIDHNLEEDVEEMLKNYVFIHEGTLQDDLVEKTDYIICGRDEAQNLHKVNSGGICILPDWIVDCHRCRQFIPPDEYFIL